VGDALKTLRDQADAIEVAQNCYVVNDLGRLRGVAALRDLALADPALPIKDLMREDVIAVREEASKGDAAEIIQTHDFLSLPVIDDKGNLIGAVRVDDLLDAALARGGVGSLNQGGIAGKVAAQVPYFQTSMVRVVRSRVTWLVLLFVAETATGTVLRHFEDSLQRVVALSFFIPLLIGTGGNAGSQTVSTVIRALALGEVRLKDTLRVLAKEASTGLILGVLLGVIAFVRAQMWGVPMDVAGCVGITVLVVCTWANTVGSLIPLGAQRVGIDPTVVSGPLITTLVDATGLFLYLTIAHAMVAQLRGH
jgi:magnesium transporter